MPETKSLWACSFWYDIQNAIYFTQTSDERVGGLNKTSKYGIIRLPKNMHYAQKNGGSWMAVHDAPSKGGYQL